MENQETPNNVIELAPRRASMESLERLKGMQGPERRLVSEPRSGSKPDDVEGRSREASGVSETAEQSKCPDCRGTGLHRTRTRRLLTEITCPKCRGTGQRSGLGNAPVMAPRSAVPGSESTNPADR